VAGNRTNEFLLGTNDNSDSSDSSSSSSNASADASSYYKNTRTAYARATVLDAVSSFSSSSRLAAREEKKTTKTASCPTTTTTKSHHHDDDDDDKNNRTATAADDFDCCCSSNVVQDALISLKQDGAQIVSTLDGYDLADLILYRGPEQRPPATDGLRYFGLQIDLNDVGGRKKKKQQQQQPINATATTDTASASTDTSYTIIWRCLRPGTIIQVKNQLETVESFWRRVRPFIRVPYVLITDGSDQSSPPAYIGDAEIETVLDRDPLLLRWYGTNPAVRHDKYVPMPLGLAHMFQQEKHLRVYLQLTDYANPYAGDNKKRRWLDRIRYSNHSNATATGTATEVVDITAPRDLFVSFGIKSRSQFRQVVADALCPGQRLYQQQQLQHQRRQTDNSSDNAVEATISCNLERHHKLHKLYSEASRYLFGASPPGNGWDCYRTWELLLLGVIPIVENVGDYGGPDVLDELFRDLPVLRMPNLLSTDRKLKLTARDYETAMRRYVRSDEFRNNDFQKGWERLFLRYWRRRILKDADNRLGGIVEDPKTGEEYYRAYRYRRTADCDGK